MVYYNQNNSIISISTQGWKKEKVIRRYSLGRYVIVIQPNDPAYCWNKVHSVLKNVVDNELGFSEIGIRNLDATKVKWKLISFSY